MSGLGELQHFPQSESPLSSGLDAESVQRNSTPDDEPQRNGFSKITAGSQSLLSCVKQSEN